MREERVEAAHQPVAGDLRDDRRGRDRRALLVAVDDGGVRRRRRPEAEAVDEARLGRRRQRREHDAQAGEVAAVEAARSISPCEIDADGDPLGAGDDRAEELLAPLGRTLLRVVQERERADAVVAQRGVVEQDAGDDERPGERARDRPRRRPATKRAPSRRSKLRSLCPASGRPLLARRPRRRRAQLRRQARLDVARRRTRSSASATGSSAASVGLVELVVGLSAASAEASLSLRWTARTRAFFPTFSRK